MTSLYIIAAEYRTQVELLADLDLPPEVVADTLESIGGDMQTKAQAVASVVRSLYSSADACRAWAKQANDRAQSIIRRGDALRDYIASNMQACGITKIYGPGIALSFRASHAVVIDEPDLIPAAYMRQPPQPKPEPDKEAIKAASKLGEVVPGSHIETRMNLQIK